MINVETIQGDDYSTEGFEFSNPSSFELQVTDGKFTINGEVRDYVGFLFDIVPDVDFEVIYDIYLLTNGEIHVDRTEIGDGTFASYEGEATILFTLASIKVPAGASSFDAINVNVRKVVLTEREENPSEQQTVEGITGEEQAGQGEPPQV